MGVMTPELVKVGVEGYEHGWVCVRPPCGNAPGKIRTVELGVNRDGTVVHRPSGYAVGHVKRSESGRGYTASHVSDGKESTHGKRTDAVAAVARRHNKATVTERSRTEPVADMMPSPSHADATSLKPASLGHVSMLNQVNRTYTDEQAKAIEKRLDLLAVEIKGEQKKEARTDLAIEMGTVVASVGLAFFTSGASLVALAPILHDRIPDIGKLFAKFIAHLRAYGAPKVVATAASNARDKLGKVPVPRVRVMSRVAVKADTAISSEAVAQIAQLIAKELEAGGLAADVASPLALAMTSHAAVALRAVKFPGDNDFITADGSSSEDGSVEKSAQTGELSTTHNPLGTHGLWNDSKASLPSYIENIAHAMIRSGHDESSSIAMAIGAVKRWAAGRGKVTPEVRAAAGKALAEWERLKAEHSKSKAISEPSLVKV